MIKITIIVPIYNVERYLEECLESVVNQTLDNIEIICINDGSSDGCLEILRKYELKYNNIVVIDQENRGQGYSRNVGLNLAKGEYVYFLDSDDYIELNAMEIAYYECKKNNLDVLTFDAKFFYDEDYCGNYKDNIYRGRYISTNIKSGEEFLVEACKNKCFRTESCINIYRREFLMNYKILYSQQRLYEDIIQVFEAYIYANRVKYIPNVLFNRRIRNGSAVTSKVTKENIDGYYTAGRELYSIYLQNKNKLQEECNKMILKYIRFYNMKSIQICDLLGMLEYRNKVAKYLMENSEIIDLKLDLQINFPVLFYKHNSNHTTK